MVIWTFCEEGTAYRNAILDVGVSFLRDCAEETDIS